MPPARLQVLRQSSPGKPRRIAAGGRWVTARKLTQYAALAAFIVLFLWARQGGWPGDVVNIPMRLDPLLGLGHLLASRIVVAGSGLALIVIAGTIVFGRAWCGWICPLGTTLELLGPRRSRGRPGPSEAWRGVKYMLVVIIAVAALLGNLTLLFFDPLAIFQRTLTVSVWPALNAAVTAVEAALYPIPALEGPLTALDAWIRPTLIPLAQLYYRDALLFAAMFAGVVCLDFIAERFWCRYLCPLGGLLGLLSKVSIFRRRLTQECKGCTICTELCPTGTIDPARGYASDPGECTMCMNCLETCPRGLTTFAPAFSLGGWNEYDPSRREALLGLGTAIAAVALFRSDALTAREAPYLIRPPGVPAENNPDLVAFTRCTRCGECLRVCPTGGLQPAVFDAGLEGLGSPILIPRLGYCDYSCNACGQNCPVQAIPPLSLDDKRLQVIGRAYIDENRCIAWSDHLPCIVCQEMCPVPDKAVKLEDAKVWSPDGTSVDLRLPHMVRELCIGCGICEYKCPVAGVAAIRVINSRSGAQFS